MKNFIKPLKTIAIYSALLFLPSLLKLQAQSLVLSENYQTASNWSFLANSSTTSAVTASSSSNPKVDAGKMTITSGTGTYEPEARIYQKISSTGKTGIIGSNAWYADFELTKLSSPSSVPNSVTLLMISEGTNGFQYRTTSNSVGINSVNCLLVEIGGDGLVQLSQYISSSSKHNFINSSSNISNNTKYYGRLTRDTNIAKLNLYTNSAKTGTPTISLSINISDSFGANLDYVVHAKSAGWGTSSNGFSIEMDSLAIINNNMKSTNIETATNTLSSLFEIAVNIYPNPTYNICNIFTNIENGFEVKLVDLSGKVIGEFFTKNKNITIETIGIAPGNYILMGSCTNGSFIHKITIH